MTLPIPREPVNVLDEDKNDRVASHGLDNETRQLVKCILADITGIPRLRLNETKALSTLKRVMAKVLKKHGHELNGMIERFPKDVREDREFVGVVADRLFADGATNWGRIISLLTFGAVLCQSLKTEGGDACVEETGELISEYILVNKKDWLVENNSWDGFVEFYQEGDREWATWKTFLAFAGFAGILATMTSLMMMMMMM